MEALAKIEEVLEFSRRTGASWLDAELHRKKGELLLVVADADGAQAEQEFACAINIARKQAAKLLELRAATTLARLWAIQGKRSSAQVLLQPICAQFGKDVDVPDVRDANALLADTKVDRAPN